MRAFSLTSIFGSLLMLSAQTYSAELLTKMDFESGLIPSSNGWSFGTVGGKLEISADISKNHAGSKGSIKGSYPIPTGGMYVWGGYDLSAMNTRDVYIDFWAKMPGSKQGLKFLKVFGQRNPGYANTTIALTSDSGKKGGITQVSFGDGLGNENDTQNVINLDGTYTSWIGRSSSLVAKLLTPRRAEWAGASWGTDWHHFRVHVKFNSGETAQTEVPDGEFYLEIDGVVYVDAKGLYNRHYSNKPIERVSFFDWSQNGDQPFEVWYDDIIISTGGFYDKHPAPPTKPELIIK